MESVFAGEINGTDLWFFVRQPFPENMSVVFKSTSRHTYAIVNDAVFIRQFMLWRVLAVAVESWVTDFNVTFWKQTFDVIGDIVRVLGKTSMENKDRVLTTV